MTTINEKIADRIATLVPDVEEAVVSIMVTKELKKRSEAIVTAIGLLDSEERAAKRLGFDIQTYDASGNVATEGFSKQRVEERKKSAQKIEKFTKAIDKAVTKGDMSDVYNLANSKPEKESRDQGKGADSGDSA